MKLNIAYPATGCQKMIEIDDENKLRAFYDKRMSAEVDGSPLGDEFKEYVFRISGGNDKDGFPMKQGVLTSARVRLLMSKGHSCYRPRREGERKRKSVRGCVVSSELSVLNLVVVKKGPNEIPGLTDNEKPRRLGPKRASRIRKLFDLKKDDDVKDHVIKRRIAKDGKKAYFKKPKIQRLITPQRLQRKRHINSVKKQRYEKSKAEAKVYNELVSSRFKEQQEKRATEIEKRRAGSSKKDDTKPKDKADKKEKKEQKKDKKDKTDKKEKKPAQAKTAKPAGKQTKAPAAKKDKKDTTTTASTKQKQDKKQSDTKKDKPKADAKKDKPQQSAKSSTKAGGDKKAVKDKSQQQPKAPKGGEKKAKKQ